jgi:hypothetical protein
VGRELKFRIEEFKDDFIPFRRRRWDFVSGLLEGPRRGAELGVKAGRFTRKILAAHPALHLIAVDLWSTRPESAGKEGGETYAAWDFDGIRQVFDQRTRGFKDRLTVMHMSTLEAAPRVDDGSLDFVFIDADHSYDGVKGDISAWAPKVKSGGWVMGHDYVARFPGVKKAVEENFPADQLRLGPDAAWAFRKP